MEIHLLTGYYKMLQCDTCFECKFPNVKEGIIIEMPKESESFNKKDNSSSEMIVIAPNPRIEEVLISDQDHIGRETLSYEARLNEKLKDLDLYEDDMTIQQKEELLEVVVASWETAEKEKTRRQFFQDYMNASEAFCNDQYEFSVQESAEIRNAIRCSDIPLPPDASNASSSSNFQSSSMNMNGNFSQYDAKDNTSESALKMSNNEQIPIKSPNELQSFDMSNSRETKPKCRPPRRGRSKRGRGAVSGHSAAETTKSTETQETLDTQPPSLDKSLSSWRPCLSPKETPLTCSRRPLPEEKDAGSAYSEEEYSKKVFDLVKEFDFARKEMRKSCPIKQTYGKPYHLTRRGLFVKKSGKPDKFDIMVGMTETNKNDSMLSEVVFGPHSMTKGAPFSRTSEGANRYIKSNRSETILSCTNTPVQMTRSGVKYGFQRTETQAIPDDKCQSLKAETITDPSFRPDVSNADAHSKLSHFPSTMAPLVELNQEKDVCNDLLPKFNHLRTNACEEVAVISNGPFDKMKSRCKSPVSSKTKNSSSSASSESQNHIVNSSCVDSDSSDSSVIDVETVVDDEINEFVLKRKMMQSYPNVDKESSQSKRLKKGAL